MSNKLVKQMACICTAITLNLGTLVFRSCTRLLDESGQAPVTDERLHRVVARDLPYHCQRCFCDISVPAEAFQCVTCEIESDRQVALALVDVLNHCRLLLTQQTISRNLST